MMYALTMSVDGSMEVFNISDTMIDGIVKDNCHYGDNNIVNKTNNFTSIIKENEETVYFVNKNDRKEMALRFLDVH